MEMGWVQLKTLLTLGLNLSMSLKQGKKSFVEGEGLISGQFNLQAENLGEGSSMHKSTHLNYKQHCS